MSGTNSYLSEIALFAGTEPPTGWMFCDGSLLSVSAHQLLFTLIGTIYGGDGVKEFALPDLRGRIPIGTGTGANLTPRSLAQLGGIEKVKLDTNQMPEHHHDVQCDILPGRSAKASPEKNYPATNSDSKEYHLFRETFSMDNTDPSASMNEAMIGKSGGGNAHENMMRFCCLNYIICINGKLPPRDEQVPKNENNTGS